jgi:peptide-methionine (S)-S-oxide reductase
MRYGLIGILLAVASAAAAQRIEPAPEGLAEATFAGGCFWCVEQAFDAVDGVEATISGYTGGNVDNPGYKAVSTGGTGHAEAVRIHYDPSVVSYAELLDVFWHNIDPTVEDRQFCDKGSQYRSAIFYHNAEQKRLAEKTRQRIEASGQLPGPVVTEIQPAGSFYRAEAYHQNYYKKNPTRYKFYKRACGRAERLRELWGDKAGG